MNFLNLHPILQSVHLYELLMDHTILFNYSISKRGVKVRSPIRLLIYTDPFHKSIPSFRLYWSFSEIQSVFYIMPILFRSPFRLLDYTDPFEKSNPSFRLYRSMSEIQSVFYIIPIFFRSPVRLLDCTNPFQKSNPSFRLYRSFSKVQSIF